MQLNDYDKAVQDTNLMGNNSLYHLLGLISEVAEVAEYFVADDKTLQALLTLSVETGKLAGDYKRKMRDEGREYPYQVDIIKAQDEMVDVYWYVSALNASFIMSSIATIKRMVLKLQKRKQNNSLHGSGNNR